MNFTVDSPAEQCAPSCVTVSVVVMEPEVVLPANDPPPTEPPLNVPSTWFDEVTEPDAAPRVTPVDGAILLVGNQSTDPLANVGTGPLRSAVQLLDANEPVTALTRPPVIVTPSWVAFEQWLSVALKVTVVAEPPLRVRGGLKVMLPATLQVVSPVNVTGGGLVAAADGPTSASPPIVKAEATVPMISLFMPPPPYQHRRLGVSRNKVADNWGQPLNESPVTASSSSSARSGSVTLIVCMPSARAGLRLTPRSSRKTASSGRTPTASHASS